MDGNAYFQSLTSEIGALRDRIRHFIGDAHWPTDGKWKEGVLRTVLRRHLPATVGIGTGFIVSNKGVSTENDILLYDTAQPLLFHDGDLVILTPDAVLGLIEVKTKLPNSEHAIYEMLNKLADNIELPPLQRLDHVDCHKIVFLASSRMGAIVLMQQLC